jgi:hypothetical protein
VLLDFERSDAMSQTLTETTRNSEAIAALRRRFDDFKTKQPDPTLRRDLAHGWMLPTLVQLDDCLWKRWEYWARCHNEGNKLPEEAIPRIEFLSYPHKATRRMLEASLDCIPTFGSWRTWSGWSYFDYFLGWLLYGLGHKGQAEIPNVPSGCEGASDRLYQVFCLDAMLMWPYDYFGDILTESSYGKRQGFYPTPHTVCEMMTQMVCSTDRDMRTETVCDPCVGTGRFLLHASNHSLRLYGMDIDLTVCKATLVNGYFYAPWLVRPIPWLDRELAVLENGARSTPATHDIAEELSESMVAAAPLHAQAYLNDSEHDGMGQMQVAPLLKRRKKRSVDPTQGALF